MSVSDQIIAVLDNLCEKLGIAIDWTADKVLPQIEALCTKFIKYEIWTSVAWIALFAGLAFLFWIPTGVLWRKELKRDECDRWDVEYNGQSLETLIMIIIAFILSFSAVCVISVQIFDIIEAVVFPEKTIYEFISYELTTIKQ